MTFLTQMLAAANPNDERLWSSWGGPMTASGEHVTPETALKLSAVFACVRLLSETIASLPLVVYQRQADGGRGEATNHPLFDLLHDRPNSKQTAIEMRQMMTSHALLRGNGYARIKAGPRGFADELDPIHPDRVTPEPLTNGGLRYKVRNLDGTIDTLLDEDMLHFKGMSLDGKIGMSVVSYARESMGLGLAAEAYGGRYFRNGSEPRGAVKIKGQMSPDAQKRFKDSWEDSHTGPNQHRVAVLEEGMEYEALGLSNKDSQFLEAREFQAEDACRWFGVPPHMVGLTSKATSWGTGIEQMGLAFVTYVLLPWLKRWEQAISRDLILAPQTYFVEHVVAGLLRGDLEARYNAYQIGKQNGWLSPNEIRRLENMNPRPDGDQYDTVASGQAAPAKTPSAAAGSAHYRQLVHEAAGRVVRKEIAAMSKAAKRNGSAQAWPHAVDEFYTDHAEFVAQTLRLSMGQALDYVEAARRELLERGPGAMDDWEVRRVGALAEMALEAA